MRLIKRLVSVNLIILFALVAVGCSAKESKVTMGGTEYVLSFEDNFDTFNEAMWARCPEQERQDGGGRWNDSCSYTEDGNLVINCAVDGQGTPISGAIRSTGEYEQTFGLYHIRFKAEKADGLWYAFWLLTDQMSDETVGKGATDGAELDIMELVPHTGELCMSVHWDGYGDGLKSYCEVAHVEDDFYDDYHELWYLWDETGYRQYLDGTDEGCLLFDFPGDERGDGTCAVPCDLIISAEYGTWGGDVNEAELPARMFVDYVQVYKKCNK